jgi:hypothetical protein
MKSHAENSRDDDDNRKGSRFDYKQECILHHNGSTYHCKMKNISISGVLLSAQEFPAAPLKLGDTCGVALCTDPAVSSGVYTSKVTRCDMAGIALNFLGFIY